ncbi:hypothetical protein [Helicobacter sp. 23-1045]
MRDSANFVRDSANCYSLCHFERSEKSQKNRDSSLCALPPRENDKNISQNDKNHKIFALSFAVIFGANCLCFALILILLYLYDPLQMFHRPIFRAHTFHSDIRLQARGIIEFAEFDSIILGSSMLENTPLSEAEAILGGKWVNLSIQGSDFAERKIVLDSAMKRKKIRQIILSLDIYTLLNGDIEGQNRLDSANYKRRISKYLNMKSIKCAIFWSKSAECVGDKKDLETLTSDIYRSNKAHFGGISRWGEWQKNTAKTAIRQYLKNDFHPQSTQKTRLNFEAQKIYLQKNILQTIRANPQSEFHLIFPPYPRIFYALFPMQEMYHKGRNGNEIFAESAEILRYLVGEVANLKNAKIYGFDDLKYADNLANYCDWAHYNVDMNLAQIRAIADKSHILTPQNIDDYLNALAKHIKNYDTAPFLAELGV